MKTQHKGFLAGVLTTLLLVSLAITAFAAYQKQETLHYDDISITLNGEELIPRNVNGEVVEPFIIDGSTFLPVRALANALNLDVDWDPELRRVLLNLESSLLWNECYPNFSIPTLDNIVGFTSFADVQYLSDRTVFYYDTAQFKKEGTDYTSAYATLLMSSGFTQLQNTQGNPFFYNSTIKTKVHMFQDPKTGYAVVQLIPLPSDMTERDFLKQ